MPQTRTRAVNGVTALRSGTARHRWGPEYWPAAVRENVEAWPPLFRERELIDVIRRPLVGSRRIAVLSRKDGVGKTVTAQLLQAIFSACRQEQAVVLDVNPGNPQRAGQTVKPVDAASHPSLDGVVQWVGAAGSVVIAPPPGESNYAALADLLAQAFPLVIIDMGSEVDADISQALLRDCDQVVVVGTPALDAMYAATACLDWLRATGHSQLADNSVVALNKIRRMPFSELLNVDRHFSRQCSEVVRIRWDSRIGTEVAPQLDELRPTTRTGFFELAAAVARGLNESVRLGEGGTKHV